MNDFGLLVGRYFATLPSLSDAQPSEVMLDSSGRLIISGRYLEDSAHTSGDAGIFIMGVRNDAETSLVGADGAYAPFQLDADGRLKVATVVSVEPSDAEFAEDSAHTSGDVGLHILTVRQDTLAALTNTDGDYSSLKVNDVGELYSHDADAIAQLVAANISLASIASSSGFPGTEEYVVTDALADNADGLISITAAATPWIDVASVSVGVGETLHLHGYQWSCDQNANARIIADDGVDIQIYRQSLNSSAMPEVNAHFSSEGRIEIPGAADRLVKLQVKKRATPGGNANGSGALHARKIT